MNLEKTYLDENIWVIENFLSQEELDWFKPYMDDPKDWYVTMRSPYKNILNKFLGTIVEHDENGNVLLPTRDSKYEDLPIFSSDNGIWARLKKVLPPTYNQHATLQSFKYMTDEEIVQNIKPEIGESVEGGKITSGNQIKFAMDWHNDNSPQGQQPIVFSFSLYLNDDFEGGELEFKHKDILIKPKAGMLVGITPGEQYAHRVRKVLGPNSRHTLYGNSWNDLETMPFSTPEDC